jgi:polar amino acid transport system substrate-binding protein
MPEKRYSWLILAALLAATLGSVSLAHAQQDASTVAPKGELRAALITSNPVLVERTPDGQFAGVSVDLANAFAAQLGVPVRMVPYENLVRYNQSIGKDEWDIGFAPRDLSRVGQLAFSDSFLEANESYVARPGVMLNTPEEVDRSDNKVAVLQGSAADGFLTRTLTRAHIIRIVDGLVSAREALSFGRADVFADYTHIAYLVQAEVPGATVLITPFSVVRMTIAIPKSNAAALPMVNDFIVKAKKDGVITDAIKKAGLSGVRAAR